MVPNLKYLAYVLRHKWFVFIECCRAGIPWRGFVHDLSKFSPAEWFPYVDHFYGKRAGTQRDATGYYKPTNTGDRPFDYAWLHHANRNPHHWQYWAMPASAEDPSEGPVIIMEMPDACIREMVADWRGAGKAQGHPDVAGWYAKNGSKMLLGSVTRKRVEDLLVAPWESSACCSSTTTAGR